ncbi:putative bifunctional diguanylate cyclase/phosphodiesterase [Leptothrix discophora]|uniref:EAL domain-containing protein n=1 Tax=Leptothrix discophora TaxID=89 RepID=A0ABT9G618_LEPDI|nr:EAL domain-containing protein [Leptothrix discophora]MDP4301860.1 EAL domain-containing protein [Leptothrix discophora]
MSSRPRAFLQALSPMRSVRARYSLVMALSGIVFGSLVTFSMEWRWERAARAAVRDTLHVTAHRIASTLVDDLENRHHEVSLLADLISLSRLKDPDAIRVPFDRLKRRQPDYAWLGLTDAQGIVRAASGKMLEGRDVRERPWFIGGMQGSFIGDPHQAKLLAPLLPMGPDGEPPRFVDVAVPVFDASGAVSGVLGAHLYWDWAQTIVTSALEDVDKTGPIEILISNPAGELLMRPASIKVDTLAQLAADPASASDYLTVKAPVPFRNTDVGLSWIVIVREPVRHAEAPIREGRSLLLLVCAFAALGFGAITWVLSGRVVRPIVALADAARLHQSRETAPTPATVADRPGGHDETAVLGKVMHQLAFQDVLTGLANRRQLGERLGQALARDSERGAVLLIDLDDFSDFNDTRGHEVGDQLLIAVARRLGENLRPGDTLARMGSDEFVLLMRDLGRDEAIARERAEAKARELLALIRRPVDLEGERGHVKASVGVRLFGDQPLGVADVLQHAEVAMFEAKRSEHGPVCVFDRSMQIALDERVQLESQLRGAIPDQLHAVLQRQVDVEGRVIGAELLVRWRHPVMGLVSPARFIPLAEENGLILPIGQWVLETACRLIQRWTERPQTRELVLSINVSAREFIQLGYVGQVEQALSAHRADPRRLKLELTESAMAHDVERVVEHMHRLKALGVRFALDDFGTGFSSLAYLQRMPLDQLKIDQSFVRETPDNANDAAIVRTVITLGRGMGLDVIAEGVETAAQRDLLIASGCEHFQGYLFGRPEAIEDFEAGLG